jgi:hypothetical protein
MKTVEMENYLDNMAFEIFGRGRKVFGRGRKVAMDNQLCVMCGGDANYFADELSRKEYGISGMCQECQDKTFA